MPESFSVWGVDVANPKSPKVISRIKTGLLVGATRRQRQDRRRQCTELPGQRTATDSFVSNGNNDMIERLDLATNKIVAKERIVPSPLVRASAA